MPRMWQSFCMNLVTNQGPLSETTLLRLLQSFQMWWRNSLAVPLAVTVVCVGIKWAHLATESTTIIIASKPCDSRSSMMKSTEMVSHHPRGTGRGWSSPYGAQHCVFVCRQRLHVLQYTPMNLDILGHQQFHETSSKIFQLPACSAI